MVDTHSFVLSRHACWEPELPADALCAALQVAAGLVAVFQSLGAMPGVCLERMGLQRLMEQESLGSLDRKSGHCSSKPCSPAGDTPKAFIKTTCFVTPVKPQVCT